MVLKAAAYLKKKPNSYKPGDEEVIFLIADVDIGKIEKKRGVKSDILHHTVLQPHADGDQPTRVA